MRRGHLLVACTLACGLVWFGCGSAARARPLRPGAVQRGNAAWYGARFQGRKTASGQLFDRNKLTGAHRTLPFGTRVRVTNVRNRKQVVVRINDRGPYGRGRIIDVSEAAAQKLGMIRAGVVPVRVEVLSLGTSRRRKR